MSHKAKAKDDIEIRIVGDEWVRPIKAVIHESGWLSYSLRDGTTGLAQPKNWRNKSKETANG